MTVKTLSTFRLAWVQSFAAVYQYGSASAAAREIGCNQSTVSRALQELGEFLGGKVYEGDNALELTPLGHAFVPKAIELMDWARDCKGMQGKIAAAAGSSDAKPIRKRMRDKLREWTGL